MKVSELKEWLATLPEKFDNNDVVFRRIVSNDPNDADSILCLDIPLVALGIDEADNEMYLCDEDSANILEDDGTDGPIEG